MDKVELNKYTRICVVFTALDAAAYTFSFSHPLHSHSLAKVTGNRSFTVDPLLHKSFISTL